MKKATALLLTLTLLLFTSACGVPSKGTPSSSSPDSAPASSSPESAEPLTVAQITEMFDEMYPPAYEVLNIFSGQGLEAESQENPDVLDEDGHQFVPVKSDKYKSVEDIKKATEPVYTKELAQREFYAYGLEGDYERYKDIDGVLYMDLGQGGAGRGYQWMTDTMQIVSQTEDEIVVEMDNLNNYDEKGHDKVTFSKTEDGWRFGSLI